MKRSKVGKAKEGRVRERKPLFQVDRDSSGYPELQLTRPFTAKEVGTEAAAIKTSILKWKTICAWQLKYPDKALYDGGMETCALCQRYEGIVPEGLPGSGLCCTGRAICPVAAASRNNCCHTPYQCRTNARRRSSLDELAFLKQLVSGDAKQKKARRWLKRHGCLPSRT